MNRMRMSVNILLLFYCYLFGHKDPFENKL